MNFKIGGVPEHFNYPIKNAIEQAIPPNGGTYLEDNLSSFFLILGTKFFVLCRVIQLKNMDNKIVAIAALVIDT